MMNDNAQKRLDALRWQVEHEGCAASHLGETTYECQADATCGLCRLRQERDALREVLEGVLTAWDSQEEKRAEGINEVRFWQRHVQGLLASQEAARREEE